MINNRDNETGEKTFGFDCITEGFPVGQELGFALGDSLGAALRELECDPLMWCRRISTKRYRRKSLKVYGNLEGELDAIPVFTAIFQLVINELSLLIFRISVGREEGFIFYNPLARDTTRIIGWRSKRANIRHFGGFQWWALTGIRWGIWKWWSATDGTGRAGMPDITSYLSRCILFDGLGQKKGRLDSTINTIFNYTYLPIFLQDLLSIPMETAEISKKEILLEKESKYCNTPILALKL